MFRIQRYQKYKRSLSMSTGLQMSRDVNDQTQRSEYQCNQLFIAIVN